MKFTFEQNKEDILDLNSNWRITNNPIKVGVLVLGVLAAIEIVPTLLTGEVRKEDIISWIIVVVLVLFAWFILSYFIKKRIESPALRDLLLGKRSIEFLDDVVLVETQLIESSYKWRAITTFKQSEKSYFLYIGSQ